VVILFHGDTAVGEVLFVTTDDDRETGRIRRREGIKVFVVFLVVLVSLILVVLVLVLMVLLVDAFLTFHTVVDTDLGVGLGSDDVGAAVRFQLIGVDDAGLELGSNVGVGGRERTGPCGCDFDCDGFNGNNGTVVFFSLVLLQGCCNNETPFVLFFVVVVFFFFLPFNTVGITVAVAVVVVNALGLSPPAQPAAEAIVDNCGNESSYVIPSSFPFTSPLLFLRLALLLVIIFPSPPLLLPHSND